MGKHGGEMTAKAVAKRIKAKGLGRLRWYCQMCEKQCRDENGFQCHMASASHQRQLALFAEAPKKFVDRFSREFQESFLAVIQQRYGTNAVQANIAYQEYIKDRHHLHMNATRWTTLSEFVKELGRNAVCKVDERDDGWWITLIDRNVTERNQKAREMDRARLAEEERQEKLLRKQIGSVREVRAPSFTAGGDEVPGTISDTPINVPIIAPTKRPRKPALEGRDVFGELLSQGNFGDTNGKPAKKPRRSRWGPLAGRSALDEIMAAEKAAKQAEPLPVSQDTVASSPHVPGGNEDGERASVVVSTGWVIKGIIVKVINMEVGDGIYFKQKGEIVETVQGFGARVKMLESGAELELDQDDLETVIPKPGGRVVILEGAQRGEKATVLSINEGSYSVTIQLIHGGQQVKNVEYEKVSRCQ